MHVHMPRGIAEVHYFLFMLYSIKCRRINAVFTYFYLKQDYKDNLPQRGTIRKGETQKCIKEALH